MISLKYPGTKDEHLWNMYNLLGGTSLTLQSTFKVEGCTDILFTKRRLYAILCGLNDNEVYPGSNSTKRFIIDSATERSILDIEIVIDLDDAKHQSLDCLSYKNIQAKARWVCQQAKIDGYKPICYRTGSRGYHIHWLVPELRNYSGQRLANIKRKIISHYGGELLKAGNTNIMIEYCKHRKTGQLKEEVLL